ncbi:hypothetical protein HDU67_007071 [Dinochytrium kinnereticum]|nr:hypothetical protein HDU67_007071 [Dinochytrium kinnereticum]
MPMTTFQRTFPTTNAQDRPILPRQENMMLNGGFSNSQSQFSSSSPQTFGNSTGYALENRYMEMKDRREDLKQSYIAAGKMQDPEKKVHLDDAIDFVGECLDMCPEFERHEREYQNALADFEKLPGTDDKVDHARAVKRYRRSAAGDPEPMPCDVRPPSILVRTLDYLFHNVLRQHGLEVSYSFVRDRARSIRTDFTLQNYRKIEAVECHERIARYHIICAFKFCNHPTISLQQEQEQMRKTLQSLREYYTDLAVQGIYCPNEAEFQAYYILSHLWQNEIVTNAEVQLRPEVFSHPHVQHAIELQQLAQCGTDRHKAGFSGSMNFYTRFFRLLESQATTYLVACLLHQEFIPIRRAALRAMHKSYYNLAPYFPLADLVGPLGFDDEEEAKYNLEYYGVKCEERNGIWVAMLGRQPRKEGVKKQVFDDQQKVSLQPRISYRIVESKAEGVDIVDLIDGNDVGPPLPVPKVASQELPYEPIPTQNAFGSTPATFSQPLITHPTRKLSEKTSLEQRSPTGFPSFSFITKPIEAAASLFAGSKPAGKLTSEPTHSLPSSTLQEPPISFQPPSVPAPKRALSSSSSQKSLFSGFNSASVLMPAVNSAENGSEEQPRSYPLEFKTPMPVPAFTGFGDLGGMSGGQPFGRESPAKTAIPLPPFNEAPKTPQVKVVIPKSTPMTSPLSKTPLTPRTADIQRESREIFDALIDEEIASLAVAALFEDASIRFISEKLEDGVVEDLLLEVSEEAIEEAFEELESMEEQSIAHDSMLRQSWAFRRWFKGAYRRALEKQADVERKQEKAVRFYLNVLGSDFSDSFRRTPGAIEKVLGRDAVEKCGDNGWGAGALSDFEGMLLRNIKESAERYDSFFKSIDIPFVIHSTLFNINKKAHPPGPRHILWKLILNTPYNPNDDDQRPNHHQQEKFASMWTMSKFGVENSGGREREEGRGVTVETLMRKSVEGFVGGGGGRERSRISFVAQNATLQILEGDEEGYLLDKVKYHRLHNSEALFSGANALIFQLSLFDSSDPSTWWRNERLRLLSFLSHLPLGIHIPLLILYWCNGEISREEFMADVAVKLDLAALLTDDGGPACAVDLKIVEASNAAFDHDAAVEVIREGVGWLASMGEPEPEVRGDVVKDVVEQHTADLIRFALEKIDETVPGPDFALNRECVAKTWNAIVDIFNIQIEVISSILSSEENYLTAWPAKEFSVGNTGIYPTPPILWNNESTLSHVGTLVDRFRLPYMNESDEPDDDDDHRPGNESESTAIRKMFEAYAARVSTSLAGVFGETTPPTVKSSLTSTVWTRLASFERSMMLRSREVMEVNALSTSRRSVLPFARLGLAFASETFSMLEEALGRVAGGVASLAEWLGRDRGGCTWYLKGCVGKALGGVEGRDWEVVGRWEREVVGGWVERGSRKRGWREVEEGEGLDGGEGRTVMEGASGGWIGVGEGRGMEAETMLVKSEESQYTRLKRRLSEAIRGSKEEMEISRKRFAEPVDF